MYNSTKSARVAVVLKAASAGILSFIGAYKEPAAPLTSKRARKKAKQQEAARLAALKAGMYKGKGKLVSVQPDFLRRGDLKFYSGLLCELQSEPPTVVVEPEPAISLAGPSTIAPSISTLPSLVSSMDMDGREEGEDR